MSDFTKTLHIFRHGETDWNKIRRLQGHTDIPLNEQGRTQALGLHKYFLDHPVDLFLSSDLMRAHETALLANAHFHKPVLTTPHLRESHLGELEGKTREEVFAQYGEEKWLQWSSVKQEHADFRFPGAESSRETVARALKSLSQFCQDQDFIAAGVCTHGLLMRRLLHTIHPQLENLISVPNCQVFQITYDLKLKKFALIHKA